MSTYPRKTGLVATVVLLAQIESGPAAAGSVSYYSLEQMVRTSSSISVGRVTRVQRHRARCSLTFTVHYRRLRRLKGRFHPGVYTKRYPFVRCGRRSRSFILAPCDVDFRDNQVGKDVIFFAGSRHGTACASIRRLAAVEKILRTPLTAERLIRLLPECRTSDCYYIQELGRRGGRAVPLIQRAILRKPVDPGRQQSLFWALGRIKSPATCRVLRSLFRKPAGVVPEAYLLEAIGRAGCQGLAPRLRRRLVKAGPKGYLPCVVLEALARLRDRRAVPLLTKRLANPAWADKILSLVLTLGAIGDRRAIAPLCARLARGHFKHAVAAQAIREAVQKLRGQCPGGPAKGRRPTGSP